MAAQAQATIDALREPLAMLHRVLDGIPLRIGYFNDERRLVYANTTYAQLLAGDAPAASAVGRFDHALITPARWPPGLPLPSN